MLLFVILTATFVHFTRSDQCTLSGEPILLSTSITFTHNCSSFQIQTDMKHRGQTGLVTGHIIIQSEIPLVINVDYYKKLDFKKTLSVDSYTLHMGNVGIQDGQTFLQLMTNLGINPNLITSVCEVSTPNFGILQLKELRNVQSLQIYDEKFSIDSDLGEMFPKLIHLEIVSKISLKISLKGLPNLKVVIFNISLENIPENYLADNRALKKFEIYNENLKTFPSNIFDGLKNLYELKLHIGDAAFPVLGACQNLEQLQIRGSENGVNEVSKELIEGLFPDMPKLILAHILNVNLPQVKKETFSKNFKLYNLDLSSNHIEAITDDAFVDLHELRNLKLSDNSLATFSDSCFPEKISDLILSHNKLTEFQLTRFLPGLSMLDLSHNNFSGQFHIDNFSTKYPKLRGLHLEGNNIESFSLRGAMDFDSDAVLVEVCLFDNKVKTIDVSAMNKNGKGMVRFHMKNNQFSCDCNLKPFLMELRQETPRFFLVDDVPCHNLKGETLMTIDLNNLQC